MSIEDAGNADSDTQSGASESGADESTERPEERSTRMNAAKAFYRAMYAGEDVVPDDFGINFDRTARANEQQGPCQNCPRLEAQVADALQKKDELENLYKRMAADFENYRRRLEREREEFQLLGIQRASEALLPALDDLDRARSTLGNVTDVKSVVESLNLVYARFVKCLESIGVKQLEVLGEPFDPRIHEPVQQIQTNEFPDGAVMAELRRGYSFNNKTLRPALVNVADNASGVVVPKERPPEPAATAEPAAESAEKPVETPVTSETVAVKEPAVEADTKAKSKPEAAETPAEASEKPANAVENASTTAAKPEPAAESPPVEKGEKAEKIEKVESAADSGPSSSASSPSTPSQAATQEASTTVEQESSSSIAEKETKDLKDDIDNSREELEARLQKLAGGTKPKRAQTHLEEGRKFDPTATADLPTFEFDESLFAILDDEEQDSTQKDEPKVYDITADADDDN